MNTGPETPGASNGGPENAAEGTSSRARGGRTGAKATEQAASAAHGAVDRAAESAARAEERLREAAAAGEQRLREKGAEARLTAERALEHVRQYTRDNPFAAAGIAFAAGMILSRLMRR